MKKGAILSSIGVLFLAILVFLSRKPVAESNQSPTALVQAATTRQANQALEAVPSIQTPASAQPAPPYEATNVLFQTADRLWDEPIPEEAFARFHDWADNYLKATETQQAAMESEGIDLAITRREALRGLIQTDPQRALELTVPVAVRQELPETITAQLEERVSSRGRLAVLGALPETPDQTGFVPTFRTASLGSGEFQAFVYGRRLGQPTRDNIPVNGIALDKLLAVSEHPLRILEPQEAAAARAKNPDPICAVSGQSANINHDQVVAESGGTILYLCGHIHATQLNSQLTASESGGSGQVAADGPVEPSTWTEGQKKVILIRVDFPDLAGDPFADATGILLISNLNVFYTEMSYGRAGFAAYGAGSDMTPTFRMPQPAAYYGTNNFYDQLRADARSAATTAGYNMANFDRDVICMGSVPGFGWAGLAYVGAAGAWLRSAFTTGVAGHELGHNWGLNHANYWDTTGQSVIGPGTSIEYGDIFDTMGSANAGNNHFNARYKSYLNWLTATETLTVTSNGTYRIYAHDNPASTGLRGLRIVKNSGTNYWVEFRQKFTGVKWLMSGAGLRWTGNGNERSQLLDTTPGSTDGKNDAAIVIGRTFSDRVTGIHITPVGKGGTSPESLDVVVNLGLFPADQPPVVSVSASSLIAATGAALTFTATASDPDGDALAYYWDFGDGNFGTNGPIASKSWASAGEYVVRCVVTDMKGGEASKSLVVTIGSPTTYRINGYVGTGSAPVRNVRVYVSTTRMAWTDSDGTYTIVGLPAGTYTVNAILENYTITSGFTNPVAVGPNATGIDFVASQTSLAAPAITTQPASQTVNPGTSPVFSVSATGTAPLRYQWRFNGGNIAGATASSYTKTNAQPVDAGNYSVVITNVAGTTTSGNAVLGVNTPPGITTQPQPQSVMAGNSANFTVTASGTAPLGYQWRFNGTNIAGATTTALSRANVQLVDAGNYAVVVTNSLGSITSAPAALTVNFTLTVSANYGGRVTKSPDLPTYAANTVVTLTAAPVSVYTFLGWSGDASGTTTPLMVTMGSNKAITANFTSPVPDLIVDNPAATFTGTWTLDTAAPDEYGADYRWAASTPNASATATATFTPPIAVAGHYDVYAWNPTITKSTTTVPFLISSLDGNNPVTVDQTSNNGSWILLASGVNFGQGTNGFVRASNNTGSGGKNIAADAVRWVFSESQPLLAPTITVQPTNRTVIAGQQADFTVVATGTGPLRCQWCWNGTPIAGAINDTVLIPSAQPTNVGTYFVIITNGVGSVTSVVASLVVNVPPGIDTQPVSQRVVEGRSATFGVGASGTGPLAYQWRLNSAPLAGQTNSLLVLNPVKPADGGNYDVLVSNVAGTTNSQAAALTVSVRPLLGTASVANGVSRFWLAGTPGDLYLIQFSTNLIDWSDGSTVTNLTGSIQYIDAQSSNFAQRFYRCRLLP